MKGPENRLTSGFSVINRVLDRHTDKKFRFYSGPKQKLTFPPVPGCKAAHQAWKAHSLHRAQHSDSDVVLRHRGFQ